MLSGVGAGRAPGAARGRGAARPAGGRREPQRPRLRLRRLDPTEPHSLLDAMEPAALRSTKRRRPGSFTSNFAEAGGFARVGAGAEAPDIQFHVVPLQIVDEGFSDPEAHGVWASACLLTPREPRQRAARLQRPDGAADRPQRLLHRRAPTSSAWSPACGWRMEICAQPAMAPYCSSRFHRPGRRLGRGARRARRRTTFPIYHPVGTCAMGSRGRRRAAGRGPRGAARRRRVGDADRPARQHQRADDRDRRARRRPDQGRGAAAGGSRGHCRRASAECRATTSTPHRWESPTAPTWSDRA